MSTAEIDSQWASAFGTTPRPVLYASEEFNEDGFQPLNDPQTFIMNISNLKRKQLYAASANNQIAMRLAQDEYLDLERQINRIKGKETMKNPQALPPHDVFEERKEAALYGYKYEANKPALLVAGIPGLRAADDISEREKHDVRLFQEPFEQGGFVPKEREYKAMVAKAANPKNIDGWDPVMKNGRPLYPKQQVHHDEYSITYVKRNVDEKGEIIRPVSPASNASRDTPNKAVNKRLTRTRFDGRKVPATRDVSEAPSGVTTPTKKRGNTPANDEREDTPTGKRRKLNGAAVETVKPKHPNQYTRGRPGYGNLPTNPDRPKHPNQYTKAKELATQNAVSTSAVQNPPKATGSKVPWQGLSAEEMRKRKWTDEELLEAIKQDHSWLSMQGPAKAEENKTKILNGMNPVRSYSMVMKWEQWRAENRDKRPRNKKEDPEGTPDESKDANEASRPKRAAAVKIGRLAEPDSAQTTPSATPAPDGGVVAEEVKGSGGSNRATRRKGGMDLKSMMNDEDQEDELQDDESMIVVNGASEPPRRRSMRNAK
ncbi:hypothetical protein PV08_02649 [Exophiala spinifera]|uniref:Uncharacterized protein n=1 Tax=Exophiala spinifera TaxID=91928 RepID=A0A0D1YSU8_9EURO|nr:uncharacterized protein PV08_02649 [Exophiala spinifera]KIW18361.1 hypothetical protein PV08_02649 [Exophiala spinifera]